jgi:hypothetical protein
MHSYAKWWPSLYKLQPSSPSRKHLAREDRRSPWSPDSMKECGGHATETSVVCTDLYGIYMTEQSGIVPKEHINTSAVSRYYCRKNSSHSNTDMSLAQGHPLSRLSVNAWGSSWAIICCSRDFLLCCISYPAVRPFICSWPTKSPAPSWHHLLQPGLPALW